MIPKQSFRAIAACTALVLSVPVTLGADLEGSPSEPAFSEPGPQRAFYIRGDFGYSFQDIGAFGQANLERQGGSFISQEISDTPYIGAGIGWRLSSFLRVDLTGEYRFSADVDAQDYLQRTLRGPDGLLTASTTYEGEHTAIVGLANLYIDLPKWDRITPYVGAGVGFANNRFSGFSTSSTGSFRDFATGNVNSSVTGGLAGGDSKTSFAWALMAGATLDLNDHLKLDAGYRYLNLGSDVAATTALINCFCGTIGEPLTASDLDSHEIRIGLRWEFGGAEDHAPPLK